MQQATVFYFLFMILFASCSTVLTRNNDVAPHDSASVVREDHWLHLQENFRELENEGIFFLARGHEPNWEITLSENGGKIELDTISKTFASYELFEDGSGFYINSNEADFTLKLEKSSCTLDSLIFPYVARVTFRESVSTAGCGSFLYTPRLHDIWVLKSSSALSANGLNDLNAYAEFNLQSQKMYVNMNCGEASTSFVPLGNRIKILEFEWMTKCTNSPNAEMLIQMLESKTHELFFDENKLWLVHNQDSLSFLKGD